MANLLSNTTIGGYQSIHTGNIGSYALSSSGGALTGQLYINNGDPTIYFQDTNHRSAMIHVNSSTFYVLRGSGTNSIGWSTSNGYWPLTIDLENNYATFGGTVSAPAGDFRAPIFYDSADTGYYLDPNSTSYLYHLILSGNSYFRPNTWIQFDGNYGVYWPNHYGLHIYPNNSGSYGPLQINGTKNGWAGIHFNDSGNTLMANSNESGFHRQSNGWQFRWTEGTMYVHRSASGGGTAYTVLDTGNYNSFNIPTKQYIWSRGENLLTNGTGLLGNNTNFSSFTFDGSQAYSSSGSFRYTGQYHSPNTDELMPVNAEKRYRLDFWAKTANGQGAYYAFLNFFDVDGNAIYANNHMYYPNTLTTLAQTLNPGDTVAYLTSVANWENGGTAGVNTHLRSFIFWNYTNSFGYTYPPQTYSRNWYADAWNPGAINSGNNTITLRVPWSGPSISAGTQVSNGSSGGTYKYIALGYTIVPTTWTNYVGIMDGIDYSGSNAGGKFPPGTAAAKLGFLTDYNASGDTIYLANLFVGVDNDYPIYDRWTGNTRIEKSGAFYGTIFYDSDNGGYYLNPSSTSNLYTVNTVNTNISNAIYFGGGNNYLNWDGTRINSNVGIQSASDMRAPIFYDSQDTGYYVDPNSSSRVSRLWVDKLGGIGTYSWVNAALTTSSIEIVNQVGENGSLPPTLAFHWYGDGGPQFRLAADTSNILYLESAAAGSANTATNSNTYFNSLRLICQDSTGLYVNGNGVWHRGDFSSTNISNWNTAYSWGNHASAGYLTSLPSHNHDDRYYTESEIDSQISNRLYQARVNGLNVNTFNATGLYRGSTGDWSNRPTITHNGGALLTIDTHPGDYHSQLFFDTGGDRLYFRNANAGSWGSWLTMLHSSNYTSYSPSLTGSGASGTWSINVTGSAGSASTAGSATNLSGTGGSSIQSTSTGTSYTANYQIRENAGGSGNTNEIYAPQLAFHWGGVVASSIMMEASGRMAIRNNPGGSYENFIAAVIYSSGYGDSTQWNTAYSWGNHASAGYQSASTAITTSNIGSQSVSYASTAGSAPNGSNINQFYNVSAGVGNGLSFWNGSSAYKISMGVGSLYQYGPVSDYSIKMQMNDGDTGRGFTWGRESHAPIAALNSTSGDMEVAGYFKSYGYRGNGNVGGTGTASWHPDGIYCGSTMWQYGTMYKNNTGIYGVSEIQLNAGVYLQTYNDRNLIVKGNSSSDAGIEGRNAAGSNVFQIYGAGSDYGFLNGTWGGWDIRKTKSGAMYMNNDNSYYLQTNSTSNFYALNIQGSAVVHAGNIGSQSVSYASTAGSADQIDGRGFVNTGSNNATYADSINSNGISYVAFNISLLGQTDGALYSQAYDSAWQHQIYGDYRTGQIVVRGKLNGTWQAWRTVIDSSTIGSQSVSYASSAGSVAWTNVSSRPTALSQFTNDLGNYGGFLTSITAHTHSIADVSGLQTALDGKQASGSYLTTSGKAADSELFDGTDSIYFVKGNGANTLGRTTTYLGSGNSTQGLSSGFYDGSGMSNMPSSDWYHLIVNAHYNSATSNQYEFHLATPFWDKSNFYVRSISPGDVGPWRTLIHNGNIGSQSVNYANSAGSASSATTATTATVASQLNKFGDIYGQDWNGYYIQDKFIAAAVYGHSGANRPVATYDYGVMLSYGETSGPVMQMYFPENSPNVGTIFRKATYRTGWNGNWSTWKTLVEQEGNTCTIVGGNQTGMEIHANVGYNQDPLTYFLLRGQADTSWKALKIRLTGDAGGQDIEFRRIAENGADARMFYVPRGANQVIFEYQFVQASDSRLKDNIIPITNSLDKVKSLRGVEFDWNSGVNEGTHDVGLIAQDVEAVLPEAVTTQEDGYKNLAYTKVIPLLVEAMKEQQAMIDALKAEIELLKNK